MSRNTCRKAWTHAHPSIIKYAHNTKPVRYGCKRYIYCARKPERAGWRGEWLVFRPTMFVWVATCNTFVCLTPAIARPFIFICSTFVLSN